MKGEDLQERRQLFELFSIRWKITLLKQRVLYELREVAETFSIVYVTVSQVPLFIYLIVWKHGSRGRIAKKLVQI